MAVDERISRAWLRLCPRDKPNRIVQIPDPATQPIVWINAFLKAGIAVKIDPCHDHHLHIDFGGREYTEYLGWDQLGPALEAAIREWEAQP